MCHRSLLAALAAAAAACTSAAPLPSRASPPAFERGFEGLDRAVRPGDDFFAFANGGWLRSTEIPPDRSSYGVGEVVAELTERRTADLIEEAARPDPARDPEARKVGDFYASFMDEAAIEQKGLEPLRPALARIAAVRDVRELSQVLGGTLRADVDVLNNTNLSTDNLFGLWVAQDLDEPGRYSPFLLQGGLGMPDRDYYLDPSPAMDALRAQYRRHIAAVLRLAALGDADSDGQAGRILELERRMATVHATRVESEDVRRGNNHWTREELGRRAPGLDWPAFFAAAGLGGQERFVVWQPRAAAGLSALVREVPLATWKEYLAFHAVEHTSAVLPRPIVDEEFAFHGRTLSGTPQLRARWKRAVAATDAALGEAVGKLYVARWFPPSEKARVEQLVKNLQAAFARRIDALAWMAPSTRAEAKAKLAALKVGVGYPDRFRDYSGLTVVRGDAFGNAERAELFELHRNLARLGRPVDRSEWVMNPQLVNAVNLPALNALNFPAAILQPPFFDPARPAAMDYGATGATIGHEISHSFDDQGALFDASGKLRNWWTAEDSAHFRAEAERLVRQFDAYRPFPDAHVNGRLTVSENIADVAGLAAAWDAYRISLGGSEGPRAFGFSADQQFFLSFAQSWRSRTREPEARRRLLVDPHAPAEYRADTVRNLDAWYTAFDVQPGQALFLPPQARVRLW